MPALKDGMIAMEPSSFLDGELPSPPSPLGYFDAHTIVARVAMRIHREVWPDNETSHGIVKAFAGSVGLDPEATAAFWLDDPFLTFDTPASGA
jgi:hypothetical protein